MVVTFHPLAVSRGKATPRSLASRLRAALFLVCLLDVVTVAGALVVAGSGVPSRWAVLSVATVVVLLLAFGHYRPRIAFGVGRELRSLALCVAAPFLALCVLAPAGTSKGELLAAAAAAVVGLALERTAAYWAIRRLRSRGCFLERTLLVGAGPVSVGLAAVMLEHRQYGLQPVGFVDDVDPVEGRSLLGLPVFRGVEHLRAIMARQQVDRLVVAYGVARDADMVDVLRACEGNSVAVHVLPRFFELGLPVGSRQVDDVWGYRLVQLRRPLVRRPTRVVKRAIDVTVATLGLVVLSPLYALLALAVKLSSAGPVHFHQLRLGQSEQPIRVLKFRTLRVNERSDTEWSPEADEMTSVGRFLRATGLDELPQLWNILRGDMALVGPRPERPFFVEKFKAEIPRYSDRHRVPVGLTGLAQVHGLRGDTPVHERARLDNQYIENWSLWQDAVILVSTVSAVVRNAFHLRRSATANPPADAQEAERGGLLEVPSDSGSVLVG